MFNQIQIQSQTPNHGFENQREPVYFQNGNLVEGASKAPSVADTNQYSDAPNECTAFTTSSVTGTFQRRLRLRRKKKLESKQPQILQDNGEYLYDKEVEDQFFASQLSEQRDEEARRKAEHEAYIKRNKMSYAQECANQDKCIYCHSHNTVVTNNVQGTRVCTQCGGVNEISMIDQTLEKNCYESDNINDQRVQRGTHRWAAPNANDSTIVGGTKENGLKKHFDSNQTVNNNIKNG